LGQNREEIGKGDGIMKEIEKLKKLKTIFTWFCCLPLFKVNTLSSIMTTTYVKGTIQLIVLALLSTLVQCCSDTDSFKDYNGYYCIAWVGFNCADAGIIYGYNAAQTLELLQNCEYSCGICEDNDNAWYIGTAIVGFFVLCVGGYFGIRWWRTKQRGGL